MDAAEFVRTQTALATVPLVPEIRVHTATEVSAVWNELPSLPYWCAPWPGGQALGTLGADLRDRGAAVRCAGRGRATPEVHPRQLVRAVARLN